MAMMEHTTAAVRSGVHMLVMSPAHANCQPSSSSPATPPHIHSLAPSWWSTLADAEKIEYNHMIDTISSKNNSSAKSDLTT